MYEGLRISVKNLCGVTENFNVEVSVHRRFTLSSYLFSVVIDKVRKDIQSEVLWCMMFADDIVLVSENLEVVNNRFYEWRLAIEGKRLFVEIKQTI
jgi:hypothetical protein